MKITASLLACVMILCCQSTVNSNNQSTVNSNNQSADTLKKVTVGAITYLRGDIEIRSVDPDGKNDKLFWTHKDLIKPLGLFDLAWKPDGSELVFSSAHESVTSLYHADLYGIKPDGSGLRKITNSPSRTEFNKYPKGTVTVTFRNNQYSFTQAQSSAGIFTVYIAGAEMPQQITLAPGSSKTITFKNVADFGKKAQGIVAIWGNYRWVMPGTDVVAGKTIKAPDFPISGDGFEYYGAFKPSWRHDGSAISYRNGTCLVSYIPSTPTIGEFVYNPMFSGKQPMGSCTWAWGPTGPLADQVIYTDNETSDQSGIYIMTEGGTHPGKKLTNFSEIQYQILTDLEWLPDGSGILYSTPPLMRDASNIFRYDIKTGKTTQITKLEGEFARNFSVSPDGQWIVYERAPTLDEYKDIDLWLVKIDGSGSRLLVKNGENPAWRTKSAF